VSGRTSAGILLYRERAGTLEVLLAHPGGPYFAAKDLGDWSIPKGEVEPGEALLDVARREFEEETGTAVDASGAISLGEIRQKGGKLVHAWAVAGDLDPATATSNEFELEWPPRSGRRIVVPEIDRVAWFEGPEARRRIKAAQAELIDRLEAHLAGGAAGGRRAVPGGREPEHPIG
jgi:predicted NUDIX family NTP pyrophosphohydrolase